MVKIKKNHVKLFCGMIYTEIDTLREATNQLIKLYGPLDWESDIFPFDHTEYYRAEMGSELKRKFISFKKLIEPDYLADIKNNIIEVEYNLGNESDNEIKRTINIDPGYLELSKVVLASTKNFSHRIYLTDGIYAEITLVRHGSKFKFLPWTYPDYVNPIALEFFEKTREIYKNQI